MVLGSGVVSPLIFEVLSFILSASKVLLRHRHDSYIPPLQAILTSRTYSTESAVVLNSIGAP